MEVCAVFYAEIDKKLDKSLSFLACLSWAT